MEAKGWLQGSIVSQGQMEILSSNFDALSNDTFLIVASQSCDVANKSEETIEFSIARKVVSLDGNYTFNKNPRKLHVSATTDEAELEISEIHLELLAHEKVSIPKDTLFSLGVLTPCDSISLKEGIIDNYVDWLASRYKRPALPSEFDRRVAQAWSKKDREKAFKSLSKYIKGVYVEITPFGEIEENSDYSINLLILITEEAKNDSAIYERVEGLAHEYMTAVRTSRINTIGHKIEIEKNVSLFKFQLYKRLNFDALSYRNNDPLPFELENCL